VELESLYARTLVHSVMKGADRDADELHVTTTDGKQEVELLGKPAIVASKGGTLSGR